MKQDMRNQLRPSLSVRPDQWPVSAVIPTYKGLRLVQQHLPAVFATLRSGDEVVIVDDASQDQTISWLVETYGLEPAAVPVAPSYAATTQTDFDVWQGKHRPGKGKTLTITVVANHVNLRFGASVNRGVAVAKGELVLVLNNDVKPSADVLEYLLPHFAQSDLFAVGCREKEGQHTSGRNRLWFQRGVFLHSRINPQESGETAWVSGGSGLFDRKKWLALAGFDPAYYPAYWEDIDLSHRARLRGWRNWFETKAVVQHQHETTNDSVFGQRGIQLMSWWHYQIFTWRYAGWWGRLQFLLWWPYHTVKVHTTPLR